MRWLQLGFAALVPGMEAVAAGYTGVLGNLPIVVLHSLSDMAGGAHKTLAVGAINKYVIPSGVFDVRQIGIIGFGPKFMAVVLKL